MDLSTQVSISAWTVCFCIQGPHWHYWKCLLISIILVLKVLVTGRFQQWGYIINLLWEKYHCNQWESCFIMLNIAWCSLIFDWERLRDLKRAGKLPLSLHVQLGARLGVKLFLKDIHLSRILMTSFHLILIGGFSTQSTPPVNAELKWLNLFESSSMPSCYVATQFQISPSWALFPPFPAAWQTTLGTPTSLNKHLSIRKQKFEAMAPAHLSC